MANLVETPNFEPGIYQIEMTDAVLGGPPDLAEGQGISNVPALQLANRTAWLKAQIDAIVAGYATQADVTSAINALLDGAPGALDTLNELAQAVQENDGEIATALAQLATAMLGPNNLSEVTDPAQARTNIGAAATLTQAAVSPFLAPTTQDSIGASILAEYTGPLPIEFGDLCDGSVLKPRETDATDQGLGHTTGTWRCHGTINSSGQGTVFQKIAE